MTTNYLSGTWGSIVLGVGNHLWQSTFFAVVVVLLTLALRRTHARTRYWLWLAASVKFLVPFSLLVILGSHLAWLHPPVQRLDPPTNVGPYLVIEEMSQPFTEATDAPAAVMPRVSKSQPSRIDRVAAFLAPLIRPVVLVIVWVCGSMVVLGRWALRWARICSAMRRVAPLEEGREVDALRRIEHLGGMRRAIELRISPASTEPGVFGFVRPVLIWPHEISARLDDEHLDAVIAHEVCHVLRRDNWTSLIHMFVEAVFWFYPPIWWMERKLVEERECACDEDVLSRFRKPQVYAESILKVCEFCVESQLTCVPGITGADLKKRVMRIMTGGTANKLGFGGKCLLVSAGLTTFVVPLMIGQVETPTSVTLFALNQPKASTPSPTSTMLVTDSAEASQISQPSIPQSPPAPDHATRQSSVTESARATAPPAPTKASSAIVGNQAETTTANLPSFEVATIKPVDSNAKASRFMTMQGADRFVAKDYTVKLLIAAAYNLSPETISGGPSWLESDHYDLVAVTPGGVQPSRQQQMLMLQNLLAERFKLTFHQEQKVLSIYALEIDKNGPKLKVSTAPPDDPAKLVSMVYRQKVVLPARNATMSEFASIMQRAILDRPVVDKTGLSERYDFDLTWAPDDTQFGGEVRPAREDAPSPPFFEAVRQQLGLRLEATRGPVEAIVVDSVDRPSEN